MVSYVGHPGLSKRRPSWMGGLVLSPVVELAECLLEMVSLKWKPQQSKLNVKHLHDNQES